jgi:hypothetical protein
MKYKLALGFAVVCLTACNGETESLGEGGAGGGVTFAPTAMCPLVGACRLDSARDGKDDCDDGDPFTADRCVPRSPCGLGVCVHRDAQCDIADPIAVSAAACDDGNDCTADRCEAGNVCIHHTIANGQACTNGTCDDGECVD